MTKFDKKIIIFFLTLPILLPIILYAYAKIENDHNFIDMVNVLLLGCLFYGGIQYILFLILLFLILKKNLAWVSENLIRIPLYFTGFYFFLTPVIMYLVVIFTDAKDHMPLDYKLFLAGLTAGILFFSYLYAIIFKLSHKLINNNSEGASE